MNDSSHQYVSSFAGRSLVRLNENSLLRLGIVHPQHRQEILLNINKLRVKSVVQVHMEQIKEENLKAAKEKQQVCSITHFFYFDNHYNISLICHTLKQFKQNATSGF